MVSSVSDVSWSGPCGGSNATRTGSPLRALEWDTRAVILLPPMLQIQVNLSAHHFGDVHLSIQLAVSVLIDKLGRLADVLPGRDAHLDLLADAHPARRLRSSLGEGSRRLFRLTLLTLLDQGAVQVHPEASDEASNETCCKAYRTGSERGIDLLDDAVLHNRDHGRHGHSLGLVMEAT